MREFKKAVVDLYDAEIRAFDYWFGKFIEYLKKEKMYDNAMIIFLSDHGEAFNEHKTWGHPHTLYNEVAKVPLIIKFPQNKFEGLSVKHEVGLIDVMPTVLNFYGVGFNRKQVDGRDLVDLIKGGSWARPVITSTSTGIYALNKGFQIALFKNKEKIIYRKPIPKKGGGLLPRSGNWKGMELYNLKSDPGETIDLSEEYPHKIRKFLSLFNDIIKKGIASLKRKGKKVIIDKKFRKQLKTLGYL